MGVITESGEERRERQLIRIVPGADDEHHAKRLVRYERGVERPQLHERIGALWLHPARQVLLHVNDAVLDEAQLHDSCLVRRLVQVVLERLAQLVLVLVDESLDAAQLLETPLETLRHIAVERLPQLANSSLHVCFDIRFFVLL